MISMEQFVKGIEAILQSNPGLQAERESIVAWYAILSDMPYEMFASAVFDICRNDKKPPFGVNLGAMVRERAILIAAQSSPSAEEAWGEVVSQVRRVGAYGSPFFPNVFTRSAVEKIGWKEICGSQSGDAALRAHFYRTYDRVKQQGIDRTSRMVVADTEAAMFLERLRSPGNMEAALPEHKGRVVPILQKDRG